MDSDETRRFMNALRVVLEEWFGAGGVAIADKFRGGTVEIKPENPGLKSKEIPIDDLFHKVVMIRESLRVLEQKINSHPKLDDADRVQLQQYVTRVYGSLTTLNLLFRDEEDRFVGAKRGDGA